MFALVYLFEIETLSLFQFSNLECMKALLLLLIAILFIPSFASSQSRYLDSKQDAFSVNASILSTNSSSKKGQLTLAHTLNSSLTFSASYSRINTFFNGELDKNLTGNRVSGSISTLLINELENHPLSVELGLIFEHSNYNFKETENSLYNNSIGFDLNLSKRLASYSSDNSIQNPFLITFGLSAYPYSESKLDMGYRNRFNSQYAKVYVAPSFILGRSSQKVFLEPTLGYNFVDEIFQFSISLLKII